MYKLVYRNQELGKSLLESGDPALFSVSGQLIEAGTSEKMSEWILAQGGVEDQGVYLLELDNRFLVLVGKHTPIPFSEGSLICVPDEDEIFLELVGIPGPEYSHFFSGHIEKLHSGNGDSLLQ